jgi:hypothetical protein
MKSLVTVALFAATAATASAQEIVGRDETTFSVTHRVSAGDWVRIASPNGAIRIIQSTGRQVEIRAEKDIRRGAVDDVGFVVRRGSGGLTVCAVYDRADECDEDGTYRSHDRSGTGWNDRQVRVDFTVSVPADTRIKAGSGNGEISIEGGGAEVIATTGNGRIEISDTEGRVTASTGNGRVGISGAKGPVEVSSGSGDIRVATTAGPVRASTGNGSIDVAMDRLRGSPDRSFSTGNGRITVQVPDDFGAELDSSTGNGRVSVDFPLQTRGRMDRSRVRGTIGDGGGRLVLRSGNGDLAIRRR